jgi:flagellar M-ring protein FliF
MSLAEVEQARVHLTRPKESVFLDQQQPAKASVMVKLRPGARISAQNVLAVTNLVASAVEGLNPNAVSVVDMDGTLLSRPKTTAGDGSEITSESLEMRQQIEKSLVAKINETLEPLLGVQGFRAGASVDVDLTSSEQQEETLDPERSVMVSSQKSEDVSGRASSSGIPGTASNLPPQQASSSEKGTNSTSRRNENVTYQTSRVIRHTKIPQGIVRRMSLAVLVNQSVRWEGDGAAQRRVLTPPSTETLKTIKDLIAGVTGLNEQRGDQLIVETLPFESSLNAEPPMPPKPAPAPVAKPRWLEFATKYRDLWAPVTLGLAILLVLARWIFRMVRRAPAGEASLPAELQAPAALKEISPAAEAQIAASAAGAPPAAEDNSELAGRVRLVAKRDPASTVNVLRMWLQESATKPS